MTDLGGSGAFTASFHVMFTPYTVFHQMKVRGFMFMCKNGTISLLKNYHSLKQNKKQLQFFP